VHASPVPVPSEERYTAENLTSPTVTLRVGAQSHVFTAHKNILMRAEYFARCLGDGRFEEGVSNNINLPTEDPQSIVAITRFLYTGNILSGGDESDRQIFASPGGSGDMAYLGGILKELISTFIIADKYCIVPMYEKALTLAQHCTENSTVEWCHLEAVQAAGLQGSKMWQLLSSAAAEACKAGFDDLKKMLDDGLRSNPEAAVDILEKITKTPPTNCKVWGCRADADGMCSRCRPW
jgi:hypothetical protein